MSEPITLRRLPAGEIATAIAIDDDACSLYATAGLSFDHIPPDGEHARGEHARWTQAARDGLAWVAERDGAAVGLLVLGLADGLPHLDQLSVRRSAMRQGIGRRLVEQADRLGRRRRPLARDLRPPAVEPAVLRAPRLRGGRRAELPRRHPGVPPRAAALAARARSAGRDVPPSPARLRCHAASRSAPTTTQPPR